MSWEEIFACGTRGRADCAVRGWLEGGAGAQEEGEHGGGKRENQRCDLGQRFSSVGGDVTSEKSGVKMGDHVREFHHRRGYLLDFCEPYQKRTPDRSLPVGDHIQSYVMINTNN